MIALLTDPLFLRTLLAGCGVAVFSGPLGCFIVWRRLSYFGDAIAHAALLGVAAGLLLQIGIWPGVLGVAMLFAGLLTLLSRERRLGGDALLGVLSHGALALALVVISLSGLRVNVQAYLFGDILAVSWHEVGYIAAAAAAILLTLFWRWRALVFLSVSEDMAQVEGVAARPAAALLMGLVALAVTAAMPVVGALLITAMLIIPAAAARAISKSPGGMAVAATIIGIAAVAGGIIAAFVADAPAGPSIILAAIALFFALRAYSALR